MARPQETPHAAVLELQRTAGNRATTALLTGHPVVQRHASWEHTMMGDTDPKQLGEAAVSPRARSHVLAEEYRRAAYFQENPDRDPTHDFPDVQWVKLSGSGLWISYGELTSLADWLPPNFDSLPRNVVLPGLQRMRQDTCAKIINFDRAGAVASGLIDFNEARLGIEPQFEGAARVGGLTGAAYGLADVESDKAVDKSTADLGPDRYLGLVARNACHFAPYSWHRWAEFHNEARGHAIAYHDGAVTPRPIRSVDTTADVHLRQAWLQTGYGEHFLQDSFAAGHLINKTLVMQWFVDYVNGLASPWWDLLGGFLIHATKPWYGLPSDEVMENMGTKEQPDIAGRHLYGSPAGEPTLTESWAAGFAPTDPQSAFERGTEDERIAASGVRASNGRAPWENFEAYKEFLNSSFVSLAAGKTHDYFNHQGLTVRNEQGDIMQVGGDNTLIEKSGALGAERAAEATRLSNQAIADLLEKGTTDHSVESIWRLVPTEVLAAPWNELVARSMFRTRIQGRFYPLEQWHDEVLHDICVHEIFPDVVNSFSSKAVRALSPSLSEDGIDKIGNIDSPTVPAPPIPDNFGDFVVPPEGRDRSA